MKLMRYTGLIFIFISHSFLHSMNNHNEPFPIMHLPNDLKLEVIVGSFKSKKSLEEFIGNIRTMLRLSQAAKFFYHFIKEQYKDIINSIINSENNIKYIDSLIWDSIHNGNFDQAKFLITNNNVNNSKATRILKRSLLQFAITHSRRHDERIIELCIALGAKINYQDASGNTALILAVLSKSAPRVKLLLNNNADTNIINNEGQTALSLAREKKNAEIIAVLEAKEKKIKKESKHL